ncbi:peptide chain release factor PrfB3, chloroplastic-like [Olea europaea var. sylvestris]|uniref:peptide chain release factor PrfB3, chloroplastic-like n=1 Tax=Olea europaea var. sylvestris TaxID=158386 RepID=UPI000C1D1EE6|nr:peptide chain release factor PrfB3, chloroplastic-like [Olea europaea var. sylvestris]
MAAESLCVQPSATDSSTSRLNYIFGGPKWKPPIATAFVVRKFSARKRIEDSILRAWMLAPIALEHEEARHFKQEEIIRDHDLWDDPGKSNEILIKLVDSAKVVDAFKDLKYKTWAVQLIRMYMKWSKNQGHAVRLVERCLAKDGGIKSATIECEFKFAYGYLSGERGVHQIIENHKSEFNYPEASLAVVDVIPLFLESLPGLLIDNEDLLVYCSSSSKKPGKISSSISIQHIPTGVEVQSAGSLDRSNQVITEDEPNITKNTSKRKSKGLSSSKIVQITDDDLEVSGTKRT